ncbi:MULTISPECIES: hypothetical protein [Burkholderia cepacia complex]|uniref:hypothetical protein n=1 Tax=Burkholderia cepacia complex TaxID=87882 RepID=UPI001B909F2C|nr:hypothetical protein [Burkholderia cenocepacia]MBR8317596.1 hypothetical protein [Burkholderia cenocepacia]
MTDEGRLSTMERDRVCVLRKTTNKAVNKGAKKIYQYRLDLDSIALLEKDRERHAQTLYETRVHTNPITGDHMLIQKPAAKPMRFGSGAPKSGHEVVPITPMDN